MRGGRGSSWGRASAKRLLGEARAGQGRMRGTRCGRSARRRGRRRAEEQSESIEDAMPRVWGPKRRRRRGFRWEEPVRAQKVPCGNWLEANWVAWHASPSTRLRLTKVLRGFKSYLSVIPYLEIEIHVSNEYITFKKSISKLENLVTVLA